MPDTLTVQEMPAPATLAPFTAAVSAQTVALDGLAPLGSGKLVVLYDPAGQEAWDGVLRLVAMVSAKLDDELGSDPLLGEVAWSWLTGALGGGEHPPINLAGTVTRVLSETFGGLHLSGGSTRIELRASWTPTSFDISDDMAAWLDVIREAAGIDPDGVVSIHR